MCHHVDRGTTAAGTDASTTPRTGTATTTPSAPYGYDSSHPYQGGYPAQADPREQYTGGYAHADSPPRPARPQWVGPEGLGRPASAPAAGPGLPNLDDDGEPGRKVGRRKAIAALGGTAAVVAGGAALAMTPQVRGLFGDDAVAGDATGTTVTDGTAARPSGQQPSTVRTYTEQNESYMGSRAGEALKKNSPTGGRTFSGPAAAAAATRVTVRTVLAKDPVLHLARRATFGATPKVARRHQEAAASTAGSALAARPGEDRADARPS